ncbi:MAG: sensor histidine kinase [Bacillota bacterium]
MEMQNLELDTCPVNAELAGVLQRCSDGVAWEWGQVIAGTVSADGDQVAQLLGGDPSHVLASIGHWLEHGHRMEVADGSGKPSDVRRILWAYGVLRQILLGQVASQLGRALQADEVMALCRAVDCESTWRVGQVVDRIVAELRAGAEAQAKYMSFLSHDLRGSLNGVILMLEVLKREMTGKPEFAESLADLGLMRKSILDMVGVMDRHVFLDRLRRGRIEPKVQEVELGPVVEAVAAELAEAAAAKGDELQVEVPVGVKVKADPKLLAAGVRELLDNAIKYGVRGVVRIGCEMKVEAGKEVWALGVSDLGPGIAPERLGKLIDPIQRLELRERGLGLSIVYQVCQACGGRLEADSRPGMGSTFRMILRSPNG